jgi:hypothetical protein
MIEKLKFIYYYLVLRWRIHQLFKLPPSEIKHRFWKAGYKPKIEGGVWTYDLGYSVTFRIRHNTNS